MKSEVWKTNVPTPVPISITTPLFLLSVKHEKVLSAFCNSVKLQLNKSFTNVTQFRMKLIT